MWNEFWLLLCATLLYMAVITPLGVGDYVILYP
jgi:hypothetical protein